MYLHKFCQLSFINFIKNVSRAKVTNGRKYATNKKFVLCKQNALCKVLSLKGDNLWKSDIYAKLKLRKNNSPREIDWVGTDRFGIDRLVIDLVVNWSGWNLFWWELFGWDLIGWDLIRELFDWVGIYRLGINSDGKCSGGNYARVGTELFP